MSHELIVRINGIHAAFTPVGRLRTYQPRISTSVSVFLFVNGRRALHVLLDAGPGVIEALGRDDVYPPLFPLDWLLLSHAHADHFLGLELLYGDLRFWAKAAPGRSSRLRALALPETFASTVSAHFSYMVPQIDHVPAQTGVPLVLWTDGSARLEVTLLEVLHFQQSVAHVFTFHDGQGNEVRTVCLFDFGDFYGPSTSQAAAGHRVDHPLLQRPDLLIAEATTWTDPRQTIGRWINHVCFERLSEYLCQWQPAQTRIIHYAGESDVGNQGDSYRQLIADGARIHPRQGPTSLWELSLAMQSHLHAQGFPSPSSVRAGLPAEVIGVWPRFR